MTHNTHTTRERPSKSTHKKCIKCRQWKSRTATLDDDGNTIEVKGFGSHPDSQDGLQTICQLCKSRMNIASRNRNCTARIRHHTSTRCLTQLGSHAPTGFVSDIEHHLGYKIRALVKHLSSDLKRREGSRRKLVDALNEGYHIDHIYPLSRFKVIDDGEVDWDTFKQCWSIENLSAIPATENLQKGAKVL